MPAIPSAAGRSEIDAEARKLEGVSLRGAEDSARGGGEGDRFITYWSQKGTNRPVKWVFFDDATFEASTTEDQGDGGRRSFGDKDFGRCRRTFFVGRYL